MESELAQAMERELSSLGNGNGLRAKTSSPLNTVTADIEALKRKLDALIKGLGLLKDQL